MAEFLNDHEVTVDYGTNNYIAAQKKRVVEDGEEHPFIGIERGFYTEPDDDDGEAERVPKKRASLGGGENPEEAIDAAIEALEELKEEL